jgi:hypothetical protein
MSNGYRRAPSCRRAINLARLPRLALLTLTASLALLGWANNASAVIIASKPFADNRPGTSIRDVVVRGSDNHVWLNTFNETNWNGWLDLGGDVRGRPTSVSFGRDHLDIYARDSANHLMHRWWNGSSFSNWEAIGGAWQFIGDPIPVSWANGRVDIFARGTDSSLIHVYFNGSAWSSWESLGNSLAYDPAVVSHHAGHLGIFAVVPNGLLNQRWYDGGWSNWEGLGGFQYTSSPTAATSQGAMKVFARGTDGQVAGLTWTPAGWAAPWVVGGSTSGQPSVVSYGDPTYDVFIRGTDNYLYHRWYAGGTTWYPWTNVGGAWVMTTDPFAIAWGGSKEDVFAIGNDGSLIHTWFNGSAWQPWENLGHPIYAASLQYGGNDGINTDAERAAVDAAMANMSESAASAFFAQIDPDDRAGLLQYMLANNPQAASTTVLGPIETPTASDLALIGGVSDSDAHAAAFGTFGCRDATHKAGGLRWKSELTVHFCWNKRDHIAALAGPAPGRDSRAIQPKIPIPAQVLGIGYEVVPLGDTPTWQSRAYQGYPRGELVMPRWWNITSCVGVPGVGCLNKQVIRNRWHTVYARWDGTITGTAGDR